MHHQFKILILIISFASLHCEILLVKLISSLLLFFNISWYPPNWRKHLTELALNFDLGILGVEGFIRIEGKGKLGVLSGDFEIEET